MILNIETTFIIDLIGTKIKKIDLGSYHSNKRL